MTATISIADRVVGGGAPGFLIAEVGQAHDGSLGLAHAFIDAAAGAGAGSSRCSELDTSSANATSVSSPRS